MNPKFCLFVSLVNEGNKEVGELSPRFPCFITGVWKLPLSLFAREVA